MKIGDRVKVVEENLRGPSQDVATTLTGTVVEILRDVAIVDIDGDARGWYSVAHLRAA